MKLLGIDIGGSGIKGALVETRTGELVAPRYRIPTPEGAKPKAVAEVVGEIVQHFKWKGPGGDRLSGHHHQRRGFFSRQCLQKMDRDECRNALCRSHRLPGQGAERCRRGRPGGDALRRRARAKRHGAGHHHRHRAGVRPVQRRLLVPNTEFGHIEMNCGDAEKQASEAAKMREKLSWKDWSERFNEYLRTLESPNQPGPDHPGRRRKQGIGKVHGPA